MHKTVVAGLYLQKFKATFISLQHSDNLAHVSEEMTCDLLSTSRTLISMNLSDSVPF